jgi:short-subunit dehydrogenase
MDREKYGPWALIIGGSEGIGAAFARKLAAAKFNVVIAARKEEPLRDLAQEIRDAFGVEARWVSVDLSSLDALDVVRAVTDDIEVGFLIYNAGANEFRADFLEMDPAIYRGVINITVVNQAEFTRHYGGIMKQRGHGGIILAGSSSSFCGAATLGPYTAAKAFSRILTESIWMECEGTDIDVLHMSVGYTATPAMQRLGLDTSTAQPPEEVAQEALDNMQNGPLLILGGQQALDMANKRSKLEDRGAVVKSFATPRRENMPQAEMA